MRIKHLILSISTLLLLSACSPIKHYSAADIRAEYADADDLTALSNSESKPLPDSESQASA